MAVLRALASRCSLAFASLAARHQALNVGGVLAGEQLGVRSEVLQAGPALRLLWLVVMDVAAVLQADLIDRLIDLAVVLRIVIKLPELLLHLF